MCTMELSVPKMSLQPIVENIFKHGNTARTGRSIYVIRSAADNGFLTVAITDNGGGMPEKQIRQINEMLTKEIQFTDIHIGLNNVNSRLRLIFGSSAGLQLYPEEAGLTVLMKIPLAMAAFERL